MAPSDIMLIIIAVSSFHRAAQAYHATQADGEADVEISIYIRHSCDLGGLHMVHAAAPPSRALQFHPNKLSGKPPSYRPTVARICNPRSGPRNVINVPHWIFGYYYYA